MKLWQDMYVNTNFQPVCTKWLCNRHKAFAIAGVACFADTFVQGGSLALRIKFSAKTPRHRKPPKPLAVIFELHPILIKEFN